MLADDSLQLLSVGVSCRAQLLFADSVRSLQVVQHVLDVMCHASWCWSLIGCHSLNGVHVCLQIISHIVIIIIIINHHLHQLSLSSSSSTIIIINYHHHHHRHRHHLHHNHYHYWCLPVFSWTATTIPDHIWKCTSSTTRLIIDERLVSKIIPPRNTVPVLTAMSLMYFWSRDLNSSLVSFTLCWSRLICDSRPVLWSIAVISCYQHQNTDSE